MVHLLFNPSDCVLIDVHVNCLAVGQNLNLAGTGGFSLLTDHLLRILLIHFRNLVNIFLL